MILVGLMALTPVRGEAQERPVAGCVPLPRSEAMAIDSGWAAFRGNRLADADVLFRRVVARCPDEPNARAGLGYLAMRRGELPEARAQFNRSLTALPGNYDALTGLAMAAYRAGDTQAARTHFREAARRFPNDSLTRWYLDRLGQTYSAADLPPIRRPPTLRVDARTGRRIFEIPTAAGWRPLWIKGVNIGAALPGKHPSEFPPDDGTYERWLALAAEKGANTIRVYTIHPTRFHRALAAWNRRHPTRLL